ncbi:dienelactone hydrolase [Aspergillus melleus]|uniref:dienelactone hydrolase n=1 Tax=Aspergillus melleus TaxID=138277 RepID=UPI001E8E6F32|nr:uncharacterized protein LDX57_012424 [Aspergillus melleus]KAH8434789.1 hypothetical protein LDX57_012424 [Aspergillus melleus]
MDRIRQHIRRRRSSASSSTFQPPLSPTLSHDKQKNKSISEPRRLYITSNTPDFDVNIIRRFQDEGFDVEYLPFVASVTDEPERERKELEKLLHEREDDLEPGERYAVVAYHRPAYLLLSSHHQSTSATNPFPRLCALVTYYPEPPSSLLNGEQQQPPPQEPCDIIPQSTTSSTTNSCYSSLSLLPIQIHLAGPQPASLHDDYHSHPSRKRHRCHLFFYPESDPGFAESTSKTYDGISSRLAWSRALDCLKRGFGWPGGHWNVPEVETVWEEYWRNLFYNNRNAEETDTHATQALNLMTGSAGPSLAENEGYRSDPTAEQQEIATVNCVPTMIGGTTPASIVAFYTTQFFPSGPSSQTIRLLSRTIGPNRIVDELLLTFTHTEEIPWLLPGVPPTDRPVRILLVMTALFVAGKIARHNIYWDQASVLVQIGLLNPALVPAGFQATGPNRAGKETVERIPVVGSEGVERALG